MTQDPTNDNVENYIRLRNVANKIIRLQKIIAENRKLEEIEIYKKDPKLFFEKCKSVKEGFKAQMTIMKDGNGNLVSDPKMIVENFKEYFDNLLNDSAEQNTSYSPYEKLVYQTAELELPEPSMDEIELIVKSLKNNKAPGENNINSELLKIAGKDLLKILHHLISSIWKSEKIENDWNTAILCPIFKKGDLTNTEYYRGISLLDTTYKVLSTAILNRIEKYASEMIGEYQCGFRKGKSTSDHIFTTRQIMEKYYEYDKDLYMIFIDFKQAYDSINRNQLWIALEDFGFPSKLIRLIRNYNSNTFYRVRALPRRDVNTV